MSLLAETMRSAIGSVDELDLYLAGRAIAMHPAIRDRLIAPARLAMRIPRSFAARIDWSDPGDPLLAQVLPVRDELHVAQYEREDPIGDDSHSPTPGIVHRYP